MTLPYAEIGFGFRGKPFGAAASVRYRKEDGLGPSSWWGYPFLTSMNRLSTYREISSGRKAKLVALDRVSWLG